VLCRWFAATLPDSWNTRTSAYPAETTRNTSTTSNAFVLVIRTPRRAQTTPKPISAAMIATTPSQNDRVLICCSFAFFNCSARLASTALHVSNVAASSSNLSSTR
jgi:hypothetical protein